MFPDAVTIVSVIVAALSLLALVIRQIGPWRKIVIEEEAEFRAKLIAANDACIERINRVEKILRRERAQRNAERMLFRHKITNLTACLDAAMLMLEMNPDRAIEVVAKIKELRATQMAAEAQEAAIIHAAEITADEKDEGEPEVERVRENV